MSLAQRGARTAPLHTLSSTTPVDERYAPLRTYGLLDTPEECDFDDLTDLAAQLCDAPVAAVSIVEAGRQWFEANLGLRICATVLSESFCQRAVDTGRTLVVNDTRDDPRFSSMSLVTGSPEVRFYAGAPLCTSTGVLLGTLCVVDVVPRVVTTRQVRALKVLASQIVTQLELRQEVRRLALATAAHDAASSEAAHGARLLEGILQTTDSMIYAKDLDGRFVLGNPALHELLGVPDGHVLGRSNWDLFPQLAADEFHRNDLSVARRGAREVFCEQLLHSDGTVHDYQSTKFPLFDDSGEVYAVAGVSTDVSDLAAQSRAQLAAEERWRALVENSPVAVAVVGADARFAYANPKAIELLGAVTAAGVLDKPMADFVPIDAQVASFVQFAAAMDGQPVKGLRWTIRRAGGHVVDVEVNAVRVHYRGAPALQVELRDISLQVAAENALRESEHRWRSLIAGSPVGIGLSDEHGHFVSANDALCALLGRTEQELIGRSGAEFTHPDDIGVHRRAGTLIAAADDGVARVEKRYLRPSGEVRWAWLTVAHTPGPEGESWTLAHVQDVTERKATEQAVADSEANLTAVAAVVKDIQSGTDARRTVVTAALELARGTVAALLEPSPDGTALRVSAATKPSIEGVEMRLDLPSASVDVFASGRAMFIPDAAGSALVSPDAPMLTDASSMYAVPVSSADTVTGVLVVSWSRPVQTLDDRRAAVVALLADQAGVALRQATLFAELESIALNDPLTGLPNRRGWDQHLNLVMALARRSGNPLTIALADLDKFKLFNDTHGHMVGDALLRQFATNGRSALREGDTVARWGGEEFALALPDCDADEAPAVLARIAASVPQAQTCSIGYAMWDGIESAEDLMTRADQALYAAKRAGRNRTFRA